MESLKEHFLPLPQQQKPLRFLRLLPQYHGRQPLFFLPCFTSRLHLRVHWDKIHFNLTPIVHTIFDLFNVLRCAGVVCFIGNRCLPIRSFQHHRIIYAVSKQVIPKIIKALVVVAAPEHRDFVAKIGAKHIPHHTACHNASSVFTIEDVKIAVILGNCHICVKCDPVNFDITHITPPQDLRRAAAQFLFDSGK
nr:MAG TPA: hypothetical protein [Caudoviricetes sp.]